MKTIGILGGVGPQTTSKIYLSIIESIRKDGEGIYPPIVIYNLPYPVVIEQEAIGQGTGAERMIPYLVKGAKILEKSGADFGILPCNTLHKYIKDIRESVDFPFLSILEETASIIRSRGVKNIGILATESTIQNRIYEEALRDDGVRILYPTENEQEIINNIIIELQTNRTNNTQEQKIGEIFKSLYKNGAEVIILACTDIQLITSKMETGENIIDTTEILINASIREIKNLNKINI